VGVVCRLCTIVVPQGFHGHGCFVQVLVDSQATPTPPPPGQGATETVPEFVAGAWSGGGVKRSRPTIRKGPSPARKPLLREISQLSI